MRDMHTHSKLVNLYTHVQGATIALYGIRIFRFLYTLAMTLAFYLKYLVVLVTPLIITRPRPLALQGGAEGGR